MNRDKANTIALTLAATDFVGLARIAEYLVHRKSTGEIIFTHPVDTCFRLTAEMSRRDYWHWEELAVVDNQFVVVGEMSCVSQEEPREMKTLA